MGRYTNFDMSHQVEVTIQIHCRSLPGTRFAGRAGVRLGIQNGNDVVQDVPGDAAEATFQASLRVTRNPKDGTPNFLGKFAHGTLDKRFIYLCWGERRGDDWDGFRRAKIHLSHLDWPSIETAVAALRPIEAFLAMTDDKGGPLCASVRADKIEWKLKPDQEPALL